MKKNKSKLLLCASLAVAITMGGTFAGCVTINREDVKQVVSTVNIAESEAFRVEFGDYASAVTPKQVLKRDLISAFLTTGYSYVQQGYSYAEVFDMLDKALTENLAVTQYATAYLLKYKVDNNKDDVTVDGFKSKTSEKEKLEYLLGGAESKGVKTATYNLKASINATLDSYEQRYIKDQGNDYVGSGTRSTPTGIDTLKEEYVPENYGVYTGYKDYLLSDAGDEYEPLDNTNRITRRKAYSEYIGFLDSNYLLTAEDTNTTDVMSLSYVQTMYISQLEQQVITQFGEAFEENREEIISTTENGVYTYVQDRYEKLLAEQKVDYDKTNSFEAAMGSVSDTTFVLYSPDTSDTADENGITDVYGYVYNILLPFSTKQSKDLTSLQYYRDNNDGVTESMYYAQRNELLKNVTTTDQRGVWFNGTTDYSFDASQTTLDYYGKGVEGRDYLFFENNVSKTDKYEPLEKYIGLYSYNGKVKKNTDGSYSLTPNKVNIDDMLKEFKAYVDHVLGDGSTSYTVTENYYGTTDFTYGNGNDKIDYSKLVYATGKVTIPDDQLSDGRMMDKTGARYKAMAAVNELQYAYTTDVSVLSQYIGYTVSAYETSYIKEFEYAAKAALRTGVGSFNVCAGDYGWHLIYVTDTFEVSGGETYKPNFTVANVELDGSFENRFYNWIKDSVVVNEVSLKRAEIVREFVNDNTVKTDKKVYEDLAELGN